VAGTKKTVFEIKEKISKYLLETLNLVRNEDKSKITHMTSEKAYFLGTEIRATDRKYTRSLRSTYTRNGTTFTRLPSTGRIKMYAPIKRLVTKLKDRGFAKEVKVYPKLLKGSIRLPQSRLKIVPCSNIKLLMLTEAQLIVRYNAIIRGFLNYYSFADNYSNLHSILYILKYSLICTLARKLKLNTAKVFKKFGKSISVKVTDTKIIKLACPSTLGKGVGNRFKKAEFDPLATTRWKIRTISSLDKDCIIRGAKDKIEMHHIRSLKTSETRSYVQQLKAMNRKQIPVCKDCHDKIHSGEYDGVALNKV